MRLASVLGCALFLLAACATRQPAEDQAALLRAEQAAAERSESLVGKGKTKAEVLAALGNAQVIPFDSGYEVWVYRVAPPGKPASGKTELIVLFSPDGLVSKSRVRPAQ